MDIKNSGSANLTILLISDLAFSDLFPTRSETGFHDTGVLDIHNARNREFDYVPMGLSAEYLGRAYGG